MSQPKPEDIARQIVEACAFSRKVKPITWTDDLYDNVLLAIREAEERGELRRATSQAGGTPGGHGDGCAPRTAATSAAVHESG